MIISCGVDIEEIKRFNKHYFQNGKLSSLMYDIFTSREIENFSFFGKEAFLKGFCFKEAFYKAINSDKISWFDIEIVFLEDNKYQLFFSEDLETIILQRNIKEIKVDFNVTNEYVNCKVLLIKKDDEK